MAANPAQSIGDRAAMDVALANGAHVNGRDPDGRAALHMAAEQGHAQAVARLLAAGASHSRLREEDERTALHVAAEEGHIEAARHLISAGADVCAADFSGVQPLHCAAYYGDVHMAELLLKAGAKVAARNASGQTPLLVACEMAGSQWVDRPSDYPGTVRLLLQPPAHEAQQQQGPAGAAAHDDHGAQPYIPGCEADTSGEGALHAAVRAGATEVVAVLCSAGGAAVNATSPARSGGTTPLHLAVAKGMTGVVPLLLAAGADPHAREAEGVTALHLAVRTGQAQVLQLLLQAPGVDPSVCDSNGLSALHLAAQLGDMEVVNALLTAGADVAAADNAQRVTALHFAAAAAVADDAAAVVSALLAARADAAATDAGGNTPLHVAAARGWLQAVQLLLSSPSCKPLAQNARGQTAQLLAGAAGHHRVAELLATCGQVAAAGVGHQ